ncbi:MAG: bifunctional DNA-formamidopyrimidine glycosylase/DNA-(apurinic or apyrimidinic site) lyase [Deltaproteobacteria bacterium]|jgi:formamidopyrimidine-DNA glycosylase|nr:bifunctional DNA-formamidopyrimidine glycosylase/DNA-(apurinic or apyrimidinic site) lyase [Deltaproteobacteria bacterium]
MPELPEVETIARTLEPQIRGRAIDAAHVLLPKALAAGKSLLPSLFPGARVTAVSRRAKLLLVHLGPEHLLVFHLKMTGRLFVHGAGTAPQKHTRLIFDLAPEADAPAQRLFFDDIRTFGYCRLARREELAAWPFWAKLGPEPLDLAPEAFVQAVAGRRRAVKALLLDQGVIAGIGNIYADEACFRARAHPAAPASSLAPGQLAELLRAARAVLTESIAECGSSIRDYRDANGDAGAFQNLFRVYGRAGKPCLACGATLRKTLVAGRATVFCPVCQRES